jgi:hypothetical protein
MRWLRKRLSHLRTIRRPTVRRRPISERASPWARSNTILARFARPAFYGTADVKSD